MRSLIISDNYSNHGLPIGATVSRTAAPDWSTDAEWYTMGGTDDEVAIDPRDLERIE